MQVRPLLLIGLLAIVLLGCEGAITPTEIPAVPLPPAAAFAMPTIQTSAQQRVPPQIIGGAPALPTQIPTILPKNSSPALTPSPAASVTPVIVRAPSHDLAALNEYQRGIAYTALDSGDYQTARSDRSLDLLFADGANYISLLVTWYQRDWRSKDIRRATNTPSDADLAHVINYAHAHRVHVLLKPQVDLTDDPDHWRGEINFSTEAEWEAWFKSYREFILYYARLAQKNGVEEYAVGTELVSASTHTAAWREMIRAVRGEYTGLLTYAANHSGEELRVEFWDDLDFIGVNNFYHLTNFRDPTIEQLLIGWQAPLQQLTRLHERYPNQPIIFTEVGYPSLDRANVWPWNWYRSGGVDVGEQADLYEALFRTWWKRPELPWFRGLFVWDWLADPDQGGLGDSDYTPHNKPAEKILKAYFSDSPAAGTHNEPKKRRGGSELP